MKKFILLCVILFSAYSTELVSQTIEMNKYGLHVIDSKKIYEELAAIDTNKLLVDLEKFIPGISIDVRYATKNNFTGIVLYKSARTFLRLPAAKALLQIQNELKEKGLALKIYDAYRPYSITEILWEHVKDGRYAADPKKGSRHNRGCAIDLTIINLHSGAELEMPTPYDDFTIKAHHAYKDLPKQIIENRTLLKMLMEKYGFDSITSEWWHYDFNGWKNYELMDIPFESLD